MARYRTNQPFYFKGVYTHADFHNPVDFELDDKEEPGLIWEPLDQGAEKAIMALVDKYEVLKKQQVQEGGKFKFAKVPIPDGHPVSINEKLRKLQEEGKVKVDIKVKRPADRDL